MNEYVVTTIGMVASAIIGALLTSWASHRSQMSLLSKQIELNKAMHEQLMREHQEFQAKQEADRRNYERAQEFHRESRQALKPQ